MSKHRHTKHRKKKGALFTFLLWHRRMGLLVALVVILLVLTGILLNHTDKLQLSKRFVQSTGLLSWYGINLPEQQRFFQVKTHYFSQLENQLYLDDKALTLKIENLLGVVSWQDMWLLAEPQHLYLLTTEGELIERLDSGSSLPFQITGISQDSAQIPVIITPSGQYSSSDDFLSWQKLATPVEWQGIRQSRLPGALQTRLHTQFFAKELPWERLLLDLHSGRFFGQFGVWVVDVAALIFLFLACSGFWIWWRKQRQRYHARKKPRADKTQKLSGERQ